MGVRPTHFQIRTITIILVKVTIVLHHHLHENISIVFISHMDTCIWAEGEKLTEELFLLSSIG